MKRVLFFAAASLLVAAATAQTTESVSIGSGNVPVTTVVPVQQQPVVIVDTTTVMFSAPIPNRTTRVERRVEKEKRFEAYIDSLVRLRNFMFYPESMQEVDPDGAMRLIYAEYFYFGMFTDKAEVHLPTSQGVTQYVEILNFDSEITDYKLLPFKSGLTTTFTLMRDGQPYFGRFVVMTTTGEVALTLITPKMTMRYIGWLSHQRPSEDKKRPERRQPGHVR